MNNEGLFVVLLHLNINKIKNFIIVHLSSNLHNDYYWKILRFRDYSCANISSKDFQNVYIMLNNWYKFDCGLHDMSLCNKNTRVKKNELCTLFCESKSKNSENPTKNKSTELYDFAINDYQLYCLPIEINLLDYLNILDLSFNKLKTLPSEIESFSYIIKLNICFNEIICLPTEIGLLVTLKELLISNNKLCELPSEICNLVNLKCFDMRFNTLHYGLCKINNNDLITRFDSNQLCLKLTPNNLLIPLFK